MIDENIFSSNGKGKAMTSPNTRYWICSNNGCNVRAKTDANVLVDVTGTNNLSDHGHVNHKQQISDMTVKVIIM